MASTSRTPNPPRVLYEDNHLLALVKPHGMPTQPDRSGDPALLDWGRAYLKERYNKPGEVFLGLVHRLDRPTGGVVLLARTSKAAARLSACFRERRVTKEYLALCRGCPNPPEGRWEDHLKKLPDVNRMVVVGRAKKGTQDAALEYRSLGPVPGHPSLTLMAVHPVTGRRHQIRAQFARRDHALFNDRKYGRPEDRAPGTGDDTVPAIGLWAWRLKVPHPVGGRPMEFEARPETWDAPFWRLPPL